MTTGIGTTRVDSHRRRVGVAGVGVAIMTLVMLSGAAAEEANHDGSERGGSEDDQAVITATANAYIAAAADGRDGGALLLCLGGEQLEAGELHRGIREHVARPWEVVVTPELGLRGDDEETAEFDGGDETRRTLAIALIEQALATARKRHDVSAEAPLRVLVAGDGMRIAQDWLRDTATMPHHLVLVQPHSERRRSLTPGAREGRIRLPAVDVFFNRGADRWIAERRSEVRRQLGRWREHARFHANLPFAGNLATRLETVAQTLDGVRVHDVLDLSQPTTDELIEELLEYEVVALGETHDNIAFQAYGQRIFEKLIAAAQEQGRAVALSLEMFERDVQEVVDQYLAGEIDEESFLERSRPWPNYRTGYRGFVETAREAEVAVLAANVPRPIAARIAREGRDALEHLAKEERPWVARELHDGPGAYRDRFFEVMRQMGMGHGAAEDEEAHQEHLERMYSAQAIKDDTMAESIAAFLAEHADSEVSPLVVHLNGRFHSDHRLGVVERLEMRAPEAHIVTLTCEPIRSWDEVDLDALEPDVADFVVYAPAPRAPRTSDE